MTTIAFDGRTMAGDGRITMDRQIIAKVHRKVFRVAGKLVGVSGDVAQCFAYIDWLKGGEKGRRPRIDKSTFMVVEPDGRCFVIEGRNLRWECTVPAAIGTGDMAAIGAMHAGASAARAVRIAAKVDSATGGKISTLKLSRKAT